MRRGIAGSIVAAVLVAAAAHAGGHSTAFEACAAQAHGATYPLLHCYSAEMKAADDAMGAALDAATAAMTDRHTTDYLTRSQKAWLDYRDAWCEATVPRAGSLARLKLFECRLALTARRTAEIKSLAR